MQALTIYVTKVHLKGGGDEFLDWYYVVVFCRPNLSFDFFYLEKTKYCTHLSECIKLHVRIKRS